MTLDVDGVLAGLKGFQRDAVEHVRDRFYGTGRAHGTGRFLVADETGLGKSIVARGIVAEAIKALEHDDSVGRTDIIYICSNADLAAQNLKRLNVMGLEQVGLATRLTLLATQSGHLGGEGVDGRKKVNLVSFTPGTSFKTGGWRSGIASERALLAILLEEIAPSASKVEQDALVRMLRGSLRDPQGIAWHVDQVRPAYDRADAEIVGPIVAGFHEFVSPYLSDIVELRDRHVPYIHAVDGDSSLWNRTQELIGRLRNDLAMASVGALDPDLVILDEFQRFRHLLDRHEDGSNEAAELAHRLFDYKQAKVLLLSATPYKPYTQSDEVDDDHHRDFAQIVRFLSRNDQELIESVRTAFAEHRRALASAGDSQATADRIRALLLPIMSRSERPRVGDTDFVRPHALPVEAPTDADIGDWMALRALGERLGSRIDLEHWKSIPYFGMFMETYKAGTRTRALLDHDPEVAALLARTRSITGAAVEDLAKIDLGTGPLRKLAASTVGADWWKMLWLPPSVPYVEPGAVYSSLPSTTQAECKEPGMTKRVVFSAWTGVPRAITALLSHEATRLRREGYREQVDDADGGANATAAAQRWASNAGSMNQLALVWPHPALADAADPRRDHPGTSHRPTATEVAARITDDASLEPWEAFLRHPGVVPTALDVDTVRDVADSESTSSSDDDSASLFTQHLDRAVEFLSAESPQEASSTRRSREPGDLGWLAAFAPGNIAYRSLRSLDARGTSDAGAAPLWTEAGLWRASWRLALGLRALFARSESVELLRAVYPHATKPHWRLVLDYCADGNLQAVLDEYLFLLWTDKALAPLDDAALLDIADRAVTGMQTRQARVVVHETGGDRATVRMPTHFALQYGASASDDGADPAMRPAAVRAAFNSPFAPFVLASTSVGQEGIDFHWWSHAVVHWNLPHNPVDFEQREGRVHRFGGHAVRKNVGHRHGDAALSSGARSLWLAAFTMAEQERDGSGSLGDLGEFAPWWIYDGPARIERIVPHYPLSRDESRYRRLVRNLALYRLTLGQPRQEDLLELLQRDGAADGDRATIDLSPPARRGPESTHR